MKRAAAAAAAKAKKVVGLIRRILTVATVAVFALWIISAAAVLVWSSRDEARPAQAIVVLGAAQYSGKPSPVLRARLDHALDLWNRHLASLLILTGGTGSGDTTSEAAVGRNYARKHGVPDSAILVENEGGTTSESMRAVAGMLEVRGLQTANENQPDLAKQGSTLEVYFQRVPESTARLLIREEVVKKRALLVPLCY